MLDFLLAEGRKRKMVRRVVFSPYRADFIVSRPKDGGQDSRCRHITPCPGNNLQCRCKNRVTLPQHPQTNGPEPQSDSLLCDIEILTALAISVPFLLGGDTMRGICPFAHSEDMWKGRHDSTHS
jgi:hypothetical protein